LFGTIVPKGVPLPVENNMRWQPAAANADVETPSLPGAFKKA